VQYEAMRRAMLGAAVPGAELVPAAAAFNRKGMPSRPLLLSSLLPKEPKKKGEVPETDTEEAEA
jgi:hypothetical protein